MKQFKIILFLLFLGGVGNAQTIINAESIINEVDSTFFALTLTYNGTKGNANTEQLNSAPTIVLLRKKNEYKFLGGYSLLSDSGTGILKSGFIHFRHNYKLSKKIKTFEFYQLQFNDVLLLNEREVFGGGLRFNIVKKDSLNFDIELGLMKEKEVLNKTNLLPNENATVNDFRITYVNSFKWKVNKTVSINNVLYYQPNIETFADYRILNDFILTVLLKKYLSFIVSVTTRYDSEPPSALKKTDNAISVGLNLLITKKQTAN